MRRGRGGIQLTGLVVFNSDNLVITHYLGAAAVTPIQHRLEADAVRRAAAGRADAVALAGAGGGVLSAQHGLD